MASPNGFNPTFDAIFAKKNIINGLGATRTLSVDETGSTVVFDRAAGVVVTLPLAVPGTTFDFVVSTSVTSNALKVITGAGTEFLQGTLASVDTDTSDAVAGFSGNGTSHVAVSMNGTTTGGLLGTSFRLTCLSATKWQISGTNRGSDTVATPFATS